MKKFFSVLAIAALLIAPAQAFATANPYDFFPDTTALFYELHLTNGIQARIPQVISMLKTYTDKDTEMSISDSTLKFLLKKLLVNETVYVGGTEIEKDGVNLVLKMSDAEWMALTSNAELTVYKTSSLLDLEEEHGFPGAVGHVDGYLMVGKDMEGLKHIVDAETDLTSKNVLGRSENFLSIKRNFPDSPVMFAYIDIQQLGSQLSTVPGASSEFTKLFDAISFISKEALSVSETPTGYAADVHVVGNPTQMAAHHITSLNTAGNFTPTLYKQFPNLAPLLYVESTNPKASYDQVLDIYKEMGLPVDEVLNNLKKESGVDLNKIMAIFTQENAFGIQRSDEAIWPYMTYMAHVSNHQSEAVAMVNDMHSVVQKLLMDEGGKVTKDGLWFTQYSGAANMYTIQTQRGSSNGTNLPQLNDLQLTYGVTQDGRFIISNYPSITTVTPTQSLAQQMDFAAFIPSVPGSVSSYGYLSMRNVWNFMDNFLAKMDTLGLQDAPSLGFYKGYFQSLEAIYSWKDSSFISTGDTQSVHGRVTVNIDTATHQTFAQYVSQRGTSDSDHDGVSDLKEEFLYHTPVHSADCNGDGISDIKEIRNGNDPCKKGSEPAFSDLSKGAFYNEHVGLLKQRNIIKGYDDGSFKPGQNVNRAEFVTMVMHAFGTPGDITASYVPYDDVSSDDWYVKELAAAYSKGVVDFNRNFRPGDTITRAEAVAMVTRASAVFASQTEFSAPFDDIHYGEWFSEPVGRAYSLGVVTGKGNRTFDPMGKLTRAEAATLISRTLSQEVEQLKNGRGSAGESLPSLLLRNAL